MRFLQTFFLSITFFAGFAVNAANYGNYKGVGGMTAHEIKKNVLEYHYDKGFTGPDAMGWDPNLQFAWSRIAAAQVCGVTADMDKILPQLKNKFGQEDIVHKLVGISFFVAQMQANKKFCTSERMDEVKGLIPQFENGEFPEKF